MYKNGKGASAKYMPTRLLSFQHFGAVLYVFVYKFKGVFKCIVIKKIFFIDIQIGNDSKNSFKL